MNFNGISVGLVHDANGRPHIAFTILGFPPVIVGVGYAAVIFNQIGDLLEEIGYFKDEEPANRKDLH